MEYRLVKKIQKIRAKVKISRAIMLSIGIVCIIFGVMASVIPFIPGFIFVITGSVILFSGKRVVVVRKIRKGLIHLLYNFSFDKLRYKINDFRRHIFKKHK